MSMRIPVSDDSIEGVLSDVKQKLAARLVQKGRGTFVSRHEILGVAAEEFAEVIEAVHSGTDEDVIQELLDLAVAAVFGIASINRGGTDW